MQNVAEFYDEVPYFSAAFADCSPLRLESIGRFLGLDVPECKTARVLELGCSYGGNILPFALHNEHADVVGIDISGTQVNKGNDIALQMGVQNFKLLQKDILRLDDSDFKQLGKFDYIIAHGLYSWVGADVKDALLKVISKLLVPNGIAYVSYNVYPGWKSLDIVRDFMIFASANKQASADKLARAKEELDFLQSYLKFSLQSATDKVYRESSQLLLTQISYIKSVMKEENDYYVLHDFLEASNDPTYLYKFVAHAQKHGLCYLLDSSLDDVFRNALGVFRFDAHVAKNYTSRVQKEQVRDFALNRSFRKSLLMKEEILGATQDFDVQIGYEQVAGLNFILRSQDGQGGAVYEALKNAYPSSLNLAEILQITKLEPNDAFSQLIEIFATQKVSVATRELKAVEYAKSASLAAKARLKPRVRRYLEYFAKTQNPVILLADELNLSLNFSQDEACVALKFDGRDKETIIDELSRQGAINARELVDGVEKKLTSAFFFEEVKI